MMTDSLIVLGVLAGFVSIVLLIRVQAQKQPSGIDAAAARSGQKLLVSFECTRCSRKTPLFAQLRGWGEFKDASALSRHQANRARSTCSCLAMIYLTSSNGRSSEGQ